MALGGNIAKLFFGKVAGQLVILIAAPIIARIFLVEDFGVFQIFLSIFSIMAVLVCFRYELSIPLGSTKKDAIECFIISIIGTIITTLFTFTMVVFFRVKIAQWFNMPELEYFIWFLPIFVFTKGLSVTLNYWAGRHKKFTVVAVSSFSNTFSYRLILIGFALLMGSTVSVLFIGFYGSLVASLLVYLIFFSRSIINDFKNSGITLSSIWLTAKYYKKFPLVSTWSAFINMGSVQLMPFMLGLYFDKTVVGHYSWGYRLVSMPVSMFGASISQVFFPEAAKEFNETGSVSKIVAKMFKVLVYMGIFPTLVLAFLGAPIFTFVFGEKWAEAGIYTQIMAPWYLLVFTISPLSAINLIKQRQGMSLLFNVILISVRFIVLILGGQTGQPRVALILFVGVSILSWLWYTVWLLRLSEVSIKWAVKKFFNYTAFSTVLLLPAFGFSLMGWSIYIVLAWLTIASAIYAFSLYWVDQDIRYFVAHVFKKKEISE